jgi:pimeloyl-ACP methyl ester carboxylesterase
MAGSGDPLLLIHGLGGTRRSWRFIIDSIALTHTVIAPDLPGHGESDAPNGDYSLGAHAATLRDLLIALGFGSASIVGHSLGGGIAMQFAYQFPERTNRLLLFNSGGLGPELALMLRAAILPGSDLVVSGLAHVPQGVTRRLLPVMSALPGFIAVQDALPVAESLRTLAGPRQRKAFIQTARAVIDWRGQMVSATQRVRLLAGMPVMLAWGSEDKIIPPRHHQALALQIPDAFVVEIPDAGHYMHESAPDRLVPHILTFLTTTVSFQYNESRWRGLIDEADLTDET